MTVAVKNKPSVVVPETALRRAGFKRGQELEIKASGGVITILPKLPKAGDEYTPEQRRIIDARLTEGLADIKAGRVHGPFTANETAAFIERLAKERAAKKTKRPRR
jgi:bifunctional DNA-binding transcriptional regulator/antitoxin component of YhaV-PrlF toxin-antitoxin module